MSYITIDQFECDLVSLEAGLCMKGYIVTFLLCGISAESCVVIDVLKGTSDPAAIKYYIRL